MAPYFWLFLFFSLSNCIFNVNFNYVIWKSIEVIEPGAALMVGTDESTELWPLPRAKQALRYWSQESADKVRKESYLKEDCLKRLYLSYKQEEDYHKRW